MKNVYLRIPTDEDTHLLSNEKTKLPRKSGFLRLSLIILLSIALVLILNSKSLFRVSLKRYIPDYDYEVKVPKMAQNDGRLSESVFPIHYYLDLYTDLESKEFGGTVYIQIYVYEDQENLLIHMADLDVSSYYLIDQYSDIVNGTSLSLDCESQIATLTFQDSEILSGLYILVITYNAKLTDSLIGYYHSSYNIENITYGLAVTQFEPTYARYAFPCFDEPSLKATFQLSMKHDPNLVALFNTPMVYSEIDDDGLSKDIFEKSPVMSTYLVAFIVGSLEWISMETNNELIISVWTRVGDSEKAEYALKMTKDVLDFYENIFQIPFPIKKLDMVAIPDFKSGAMENWGLITFRDTALLYDQIESSASNKQRVTTVIAHELAHQWFGNLVTLKWWDDLWLNEGFATFMEYYGTNAAEKSWNMLSQVFIEEHIPAFDYDSSFYTHAITAKVDSMAEIQELFDSISYSKGSILIGMIKAIMDNNEDDVANSLFFKRIREHLKKYAFDNANTGDLITSLQGKSTEFNLKDFVEQWSLFSGHPFISIKHESGKHIITQERYLTCRYNQTLHSVLVNDLGMGSLYPLSKAREQLSYIWNIPLTYKCLNSKKDEKPKKVMMKEKTIEIKETCNVIQFNIGASGFYHVFYPLQDYLEIFKKIKSHPNDFTAAERSSIYYDITSFILSDRIDAFDLIDPLFEVIKAEREYTVWVTIFSQLEKVKRTIDGSSILPAFIEQVSDSINPLIVDLLHKIAKDKISHLDQQLISLAFAKGVKYEVKILIDFLSPLYEGLKNGEIYKEDISPMIRSSVYLYAIKYGNQEDFEFIKSQYLEATFAPEKDRLLSALATTLDRNYMNDLLKFSLSGSVRSQDVAGLISQIALNSHEGRKRAFAFFVANYESLYKIGGLERMIKNLLSHLDADYVPKIIEFFKAHPLPSANRAIAQSVENIQRTNIWQE